jgi:bifunctional ADP-heptose synthase (sugar kinase/adenylyltransferase)
MLKDAKLYCNHLTVALHEDPSVERSYKLQPVQSVEERTEILRSIKYIDNVITYSVEDQYLDYLRSGEYNVRFLGTDYKTAPYTGQDIPIDIIWLDRESHEYSSTKLKTQIYESILVKKLEHENYD